MFLRDLTDCMNIISVSCKIGCMCTYDHLCLRPDCSFHICKGYPALSVSRKNCQLQTFFFQGIKRAKYTVMIHLCCNSMDRTIPWMQNSEQCCVQRFCGITGKSHTFRPVCLKHFCYPASCIKNKVRCFHRFSAVSCLVHGLHYSCKHTVWFMKACGCIIQINHLKSPCAFCKKII